MEPEIYYGQGYVVWRSGEAQPIDVIEGDVYIDSFGPFSWREILTEFGAVRVCIEEKH